MTLGGKAYSGWRREGQGPRLVRSPRGDCLAAPNMWIALRSIPEKASGASRGDPEEGKRGRRSSAEPGRVWISARALEPGAKPPCERGAGDGLIGGHIEGSGVALPAPSLLPDPATPPVSPL